MGRGGHKWSQKPEVRGGLKAFFCQISISWSLSQLEGQETSSTFPNLASIHHFLQLIKEIEEGLRSHNNTWSSKKWPYIKSKTRKVEESWPIFILDWMFLDLNWCRGQDLEKPKIRFQDLFLEGRIDYSVSTLPQDFGTICDPTMTFDFTSMIDRMVLGVWPPKSFAFTPFLNTLLEGMAPQILHLKLCSLNTFKPFWIR